MTRRASTPLSLDLLRGFRDAARHLSFTRAANELFVTQSAISRAIKTLETQLGQPLFHRSNRTLQLTHAGIELYRAVDEALGLIDAAADRVAGARRGLSITTSTALASLWLVPRLAQFTRLYPEIDVRIAATYEPVNLEREHLDVAIRYVRPDGEVPNGEWLVDYELFPVCSPRLARSRSRPLRTPTDLAHHVLLDFERIVFGRPWSDWAHWFDAMNIRPVKPASTLRFSHYDQAIQAAIEGNGVAIGKRPHLTRHLRDGVLCTPFGADWVTRLGGFVIVLAPGAAEREPVAAFVAWLKEEIRRGAELAPAWRRGARPSVPRRAPTAGARPRARAR